MYVYFIYNNEVIYFMMFSLYLLAFSVSIVLSCLMAYGSVEIAEARQEGDQQGIKDAIQEKKIGSDQLKIFLCMQNFPWNGKQIICLRPHYALEPNAITKNYKDIISFFKGER